MDGKKGKANGKSHPVNKKCTVELYFILSFLSAD
jgi:hypothetical protein